jgi:hypothetical protein
MVDFVESPDPKGLSTFGQCAGSDLTWDSNSCLPDKDLDALAKELASRLLF